MHTLLTLTYFSCFVTIPLQWGLVGIDTKTVISYPISVSKILAAIGVDGGTYHTSISLNIVGTVITGYANGLAGTYYILLCK